MPKLNGKTIFFIVFFLGIFSVALLLLAYLFTGSTLLSLLSLVQEAASKLEPFDIPIELSPFVEPRIHDFLYDGHRARILVHIGTVFDPSGAHADRSYQLRLLEDLQRGAFMC